MKIFISYSTDDEKIVRKITNLIPSSIYIWIDHKTLDGGNILNNKIKKGINESDIFFLFISDKSISSKWVKKEVQWALEKEKRIKKELIIPIVLNKKTWEGWGNKKIKKRIYISLENSKNIYISANEIKDAILGVALEDRNDCIYKHDIYKYIMGVFLFVFSVVAFFNAPLIFEMVFYIEMMLESRYGISY